MIGKGFSISRTGASIAYGWNQEKEAEVVLREYLAGETPGEITEEFKIIQSQNQRCTNNTLSFIVSPTVEDGKNMRRKNLGEIAQKFLHEMKLQTIRQLHLYTGTNSIPIFIFIPTGAVLQEKFTKTISLESGAKINEKVVESRPKSFDTYIRLMQEHIVKVIPTINKSNEIQGFRFE